MVAQESLFRLSQIFVKLGCHRLFECLNKIYDPLSNWSRSSSMILVEDLSSKGRTVDNFEREQPMENNFK